MKNQNARHRNIQAKLNIINKGTPIHNDTYQLLSSVMDTAFKKTTLRHLTTTIKRSVLIDYALSKFVYEVNEFKGSEDYIKKLSNDIRRHFITSLLSDGIKKTEIIQVLTDVSKNIKPDVIKKTNSKTKPKYFIKS